MTLPEVTAVLCVFPVSVRFATVWASVLAGLAAPISAAQIKYGVLVVHEALAAVWFNAQAVVVEKGGPVLPVLYKRV
jgi:hypothetical protein